GIEGQTTTLNGTPVSVRPCPALDAAWVYATAPEMFVGPDSAAFDRLRDSCRGVVYGADCYAYGLLANGTVDLVCEASTKPYDYCALVPVVRGAGGIISDWAGQPLGLASDGRVLAAGDAAAHAAALQILAG
ncbi:MAG: inositol monophosphatase family protein, partial [Rhodospirillales bacterium]